MQVSGLLNTKARLNHALARLDGLESLPQAAPIRRKLAPALAAVMGGSLLVNHVRHAPTAEMKKKVLVRDVLVLGGTTAGVLGGMALMRGKSAYHVHGAARTLGEQLKALYRNHLCDHGASGFAKLLVLAMGGVLGGGLGGTVADAVNGENLAQTVPMKLKEGIFQFFGNVAICTGAILVFSKGGQRVGSLLSRLKPLASRAESSILKRAREAAALPAAHPGLFPTGLTQELTGVLKQAELAAKKNPSALPEIRHEFRHVLRNWLPDVPREKIRALSGRLDAVGSAESVRALQEEINALAGEVFRPKLAGLARFERPEQLPAGEWRDALSALGRDRLEGQAQLLGVMVGLVSGVIGGAWASNHLNRLLTRWLHLPEGHHQAQLFHGASDSGSKGWLSHQVGERGIHWWDAILHVDDWPSVLYMAGVQALESVIGVLYGVSGFLTGIAGTQYNQPSRRAVPPVMSHQLPLHRTQAAFQVFQTPHA